MFLRTKLKILDKTAVKYLQKSDQHMRGIGVGIGIALDYIRREAFDSTIKDVLEERKKR